MHLYDLLKELKIDSSKEFCRLNNLLQQKDLWYNSQLCSLNELIDTFFKELKVRQSFLSLDDLLTELRLNESFHNRQYSIEKLLLLFEVVLTIFHQGKDNLLDLNHYYSEADEIQVRVFEVLENITFVCNKLNYEKYSKDDFIFIVPSCFELEEAIRNTADELVAIELLHYNHHSLKGNLSEKRKVLTHLASHIEPLLNSKALSGNGYKQLETDIGFYLNNLNIRHNNLDGKKKQALCVDIEKKDELELWYDKTYNTIIMCIIAEKQIQHHNELEVLKANYGM